MNRPIIFVIFVLIVGAFACRAEAGVISQQWENDSVSEISDASFEMATAPTDNHSPIVKDLDLESAAAGAGAPVASSAGLVGVLPNMIRLPIPRPLSLKLRFENSLLPPNPVLDGLLKPS